MLPSFILSLREGLEASLIIGIVLGTLRRLERQRLSFVVWLGAGSAALLSIVAALLLTRFGFILQDPGEAIFESLTMLMAAGILTWMFFWLAQQSGNKKGSLETRIIKASTAGTWSLFSLAFIAVLREGVELALYLTAAAFASNGQVTFIGALIGLGVAVLLGGLIFTTAVRINLRRFFQVTGFILLLFAAGLVLRGAGELVIAGWIPPIIPHIWDLGKVLSDDSVLGQTFGVLFGYSASPSLIQALAYGLYFCIVLLGLVWTNIWSAKKAARV